LQPVQTDAPASLIGEIGPVTITDLGRNSLFGTLMRDPAIDPVTASVGA
jgi:hypothetical protein